MSYGASLSVKDFIVKCEYVATLNVLSVSVSLCLSVSLSVSLSFSLSVSHLFVREDEKDRTRQLLFLEHRAQLVLGDIQTVRVTAAGVVQRV